MRVAEPAVLRFLLGGLLFSGGSASAQAYPSKPVRVVTSEAGGANDFTSRLIALGISDSLGQPVIIENRGGGVNISGEIVAKASPDGYTLLVTGSSFWIGPLLQKAAYDPVQDFSPVTLPVSAPLLLVVHPALPAKSVKELIALAKAKPGTLNYGSSPTGSSSHLAAELFKALAGVDIVRITYRGNGPALNALLGGELQLMFPAAGVLTPHLNAGRLRALAVTSARPSALFPSLPTVAASGVPGYESVSIVGMFAPAKTPGPIINRLNAEIARVLNSPDVKEKFFSAGIETVASAPSELAATVKFDMARLSKLIKDVGIRGE